MKRIMQLALLNVLLIALSLVFVLSYIEERDLAFLVPGVIFTTGAVCFLCLLGVQIVFGCKTYVFADSSVHIWQKGKMRRCIHRDDVFEITLVLDVFTEAPYLVSFVSEGKKYYVAVNHENENDILGFIEGKGFAQKKNWWYYLIMFFSH